VAVRRHWTTMPQNAACVKPPGGFGQLLKADFHCPRRACRGMLGLIRTNRAQPQEAPMARSVPMPRVPMSRVPILCLLLAALLPAAVAFPAGPAPTWWSSGPRWPRPPLPC
jgi:hypothetical protein